MISAIVCVDKNWSIGFNGQLLEHIPEDMKYFKKLTTGNIVVMGRKTWDSIPNKPLKDRLNIVISTKPKEVLGEMSIMVDMQEAKVRLAMASPDEQWFIIGGGQIYKELLPYCEYAYVTKIFHCYDNADAYFPNIDNIPEWEMVYASEIKEYKNIKYQFCKYKKKEV